MEDLRAVTVAQGIELTVAQGASLTPKQDAFARRYAEIGVAVDAYCAVYDTGGSRVTARVNAYKLLRQPKVAAKVREYQNANAAASQRSTEALIADLEAAVDADPNELVRLDVGCCRHCWGVGGGYQWRDVQEFARAFDRYIAALGTPKPLPAPDDAGGFEYRADREANPECDACHGSGIPRVVFSSSADVSPGARRLLRGIELHADGTVKRILLHDQTALRVELHRLRGMHIDRSLQLQVSARVDVGTAEAKRFATMSDADMLTFLDSLAPVPERTVAVRSPTVIDVTPEPVVAPVPAPEPVVIETYREAQARIAREHGHDVQELCGECVERLQEWRAARDQRNAERS